MRKTLGYIAIIVIYIAFIVWIKGTTPETIVRETFILRMILSFLVGLNLEKIYYFIWPQK